MCEDIRLGILGSLSRSEDDIDSVVRLVWIASTSSPVSSSIDLNDFSVAAFKLGLSPAP